MHEQDDDLAHFEAQGLALPPGADLQGSVTNVNADIWFTAYGSGMPVFLLHGGLGHSGNWAHQVPAIVGVGARAVLVDSRGHGRSTRDGRPYSYELMASDVLAVMDALSLPKAVIVGWSDGACTGLVLAARHPERVAGVFFFACNMDPSGTKELQPSPMLDRCFARHTADYAALSPTPDEFTALAEAVGQMQKSQPNYTRSDLLEINVPVAIVQAEYDEFINPEHAGYLARNIPGAELIELPGVSHFAPLQRPAQFNRAMLDFLRRILPT